MALETGDYINDLVQTNPASGDSIAQGDDHLRLIKKVLKNCFPGLTSALLDSSQRVEKAHLPGDAVYNDTSGSGDTVTKQWYGTQTEYDAIASKDDETEYNVYET